MRKTLLSHLVLGLFLIGSFSSLTVFSETTTTSANESTMTQSSSTSTSTVASTTAVEPSTTSSSAISPSMTTSSMEPITTTTESSVSETSTVTTTETDSILPESREAVLESDTASVAIYRLYNASNGEHLYTTDANEKKVLYERHGWGYEGIGWYAPKTGTPVYRLYNEKLQNHLYTTDKNEVKVLTSRYGWTSDNRGKPVFYSGGKIKIYRVYNAKLRGLHHWTTDLNEYNVLPRHGWKQEGVKFTGVRNGKPILTQYYMNQKEINIQSIAKGDLSSLEGTWRNGFGHTVSFSKTTFLGDNLADKQYYAGITSPSLTSRFASGTYLIGNIRSSTHFLYNTSILIIPKNVQVYAPSSDFDWSDITKDRFILGGTGAPSTNKDNKYYYYRVR